MSGIDQAVLAEEALDELTTHILPFWAGRAVDDVRGGFVGRIDGQGRTVPDAPKGSVLGCRILWTFAAASRVSGDRAWSDLADRAYRALWSTFRDPVYGGVYWSVGPDGVPLDSKKQTYAQAFAVYGLAEYARADGSPEALAWACELYRLVEERAADPGAGGYFEAFRRDWGPAEDVRLSERDDDAPKTMNTHIHVLEAYTALFRVWPDPGLAERLRELVGVVLDRIIDSQTGHLVSFFETDWTPRPGPTSYGHDVETSWLLRDAASVLGDRTLLDRVTRTSDRLARLTLTEGVDTDGGVFYERTADGRLDADKHWWPQAEAVVGFLDAYDRTGDPAFAEAAGATWAFARRVIADREGGEWFFRVDRDGAPYVEEDKVGIWKCPYHNARACLHLLERDARVRSISLHESRKRLQSSNGLC